MTLRLHALIAGALAFLPWFSQEALADGPAKPWEMGFQEAASPVAERIHELHHLLFWIITAIVLFVLVLLIYVIVKFNEKANPVPSKTTHNTFIEVLWTVVPIIILVIISVPSFKLLFFMDKYENPDMTLKVTGHQWYWSYTYPDDGNFSFDSQMVQTSDLKPGQPRLLTVDNAVVLPVDTNIRILQTSTDVIHDFAVPAFGLKLDAVPGRINEDWVRITKPGTYYGQCSELCGVGHSYMPIEVHAVSKEAFKAWVAKAKKQFAQTDGAPATAAIAQIQAPQEPTKKAPAVTMARAETAVR